MAGRTLNSIFNINLEPKFEKFESNLRGVKDTFSEMNMLYGDSSRRLDKINSKFNDFVLLGKEFENLSVGPSKTFFDDSLDNLSEAKDQFDVLNNKVLTFFKQVAQNQDLDKLSMSIGEAKQYSERLNELRPLIKYGEDVKKATSQVNRLATAVGGVAEKLTFGNSAAQKFFSIFKAGFGDSITKVLGLNKSIKDISVDQLAKAMTTMSEEGNFDFKSALSSLAESKGGEGSTAGKLLDIMKDAGAKPVSSIGDTAETEFTKYVKSSEKLSLAGENIEKLSGSKELVTKSAKKLSQGASVATESVGKFSKSAAASTVTTKAASGSMGKLAFSATKLGGPLAIATVAIYALQAALKALEIGFKANAETMEKFRLSGYRAAGSIRELTNATFQLSKDLGMTTEESAKAVGALSHAGITVNDLKGEFRALDGSMVTGREAFNELASQVGMFSVATGASAEKAAMLQRRLISMGEIDAAASMLGKLSYASEQFGLTANDLNSIMADLTEKTSKLELVWTDTNADEYTTTLAVMSGTAKKLGYDLGIVKRVTDDAIKGGSKSMALLALAGKTQLMFQDDQNKIMGGLGMGAQELLKMTAEMPAYVRQAMLESMGGGEKEVQMLAEMEKERERMRKEGTLAAFEAEQEAAKKLRESYDKSMGTLQRRLNEIFEPIMSSLYKLVGPLVDVFVEATDAIKPFVKDILYFFDGIAEIATDVFSLFGIEAESMGGMLKFIGTIFRVIMFPINLFMDQIRFVVKLVKLAKNTFEDWVASFGPLGEAVKALMNPLGTLFSFFGDDKEKSLIPKLSEEEVNNVFRPIDMLNSKFDETSEKATNAKESMKGSSFLRIKEGVEEVQPSLSSLNGKFDTLSDGAINAKDKVKTFSKNSTGNLDEVINSLQKMPSFGRDELLEKINSPFTFEELKKLQEDPQLNKQFSEVLEPMLKLDPSSIDIADALLGAGEVMEFAVNPAKILSVLKDNVGGVIESAISPVASVIFNEKTGDEQTKQLISLVEKQDMIIEVLIGIFKKNESEEVVRELEKLNSKVKDTDEDQSLKRRVSSDFGGIANQWWGG